MKRVAACVLLLPFFCAIAQGQGVISDVFSGKLVNPKAGAWAWYDVTGAQTEGGGTVQLGKMRLAIVGEETVKGKQGYWLEMEYIPSLGYPSIYKMLLTGPADDPANVQKVFRRDGTEKKEEVPLKPEGKKKDRDKAEESPPEPKQEPERKLVGEEDIATSGGNVQGRSTSVTLHAQHYEVVDGNATLDIWLNESVSPMGIVQMKSGEGGLLLRDHGTGGAYARSVIDEPPPTAKENPKGGVKVDVRVEREPKRTTPAKPSKGRPQ